MPARRLSDSSVSPRRRCGELLIREKHGSRLRHVTDARMVAAADDDH
jgi:hypothetical protein